MAHTCDTFVSTCIDFRFQKFINKWLAKNKKPHSHDRVAFAGGVKHLDILLEQIEISNRLHKIKEVILTNHEDCGAYGEAGTPETHAKDLRVAKAKVKKMFPHLKVETYFIRLDGSFEKVS